MLKSIKRSDSYLLESSSSNNSTSNIITTSTNNTQNSLLKEPLNPMFLLLGLQVSRFLDFCQKILLIITLIVTAIILIFITLIIIIASIPQFMASLLQAEEIIFKSMFLAIYQN